MKKINIKLGSIKNKLKIKYSYQFVIRHSSFVINKRGFSLVEMLVVVAILAILTRAVFVRMNPASIAGGHSETLAQNITSALQTAQSLAVANGQRYDVVLYSNQNDSNNPCPTMEQVPNKPETNDYVGNTTKCGTSNRSYTCYWIRNYTTLEVYKEKEDLYKVDNDVCIRPYGTAVTERAKIFAFFSDGSAKIYKYDETPISNPNTNNRIRITGGYILGEITVTQATGAISLTMCKQDVQFYPSSGNCGL